MINWTDPTCPVSRYFSVREAISFPRWNRLATATDGLDDAAKGALVDLFSRMDAVREVLGAPILVHVAFRSLEYNALIGGAKFSPHIARMIKEPEGDTPVAAVDFDADLGESDQAANCDMIRRICLPKLTAWGMRMEDKPGSIWVHLDTKPVPFGGRRCFIP